MYCLCRRLLATLVLLTPAFASPFAAQFVERAPVHKARKVKADEKARAATSLDPKAAELLQQTAIDYSPSGAKARLKVARLWLEVTDHDTVPIVIVANPTLLLPEGKDSATFSAKELLSQFGGLLNIAAVRSWSAPGAVEGQKGTQGDLRVGAKFVQFAATAGGAPSTSTVGHVGVSISHFMRAFGERLGDGGIADTASQVGLVTLNLRGGLSYLGSERYRLLFSDAQGEAPPNVFATFQLDTSVHLFDQLFLSAGIAGSTNKRLGEQGFFGVTVSRSQPQ